MKFFKLLLLFVCFSHFLEAANHPTFSICKSPVWKQQKNLNFSQNFENVTGAESYLLFDLQENKLSSEKCYHYCIRLNNEEGVQNHSQLYFTFYPDYQELSLSKIVIHRKGKTINKLKKDKIEVMRNEKNVDRFMYDGSYSAVAILEDIRVGDLLEYEFTVKGQNPIFKGTYYSHTSQAYSIQIGHLYRRVISSQQLQVKNNFGGAAPVITKNKGQYIYTWEKHNVKPIFADENLPTWYGTYPISELSSFLSWGKVREHLEKLYPFDSEYKKLDQFLKEEQIVKSEKGILSLIRFVQDQIRYLGIEIGANTHRPHNPEKVLKQRFGDCKDKSFLLSTLLRKIGVQAWPAVVNTNLKSKVDQYISSPLAFNHVIVKFYWKGKYYWVDPTSNFERGDLSTMVNPRYGKALVLNGKAKHLESIPEHKASKIVINENFWFTDSISDVKYDVESIFTKNNANGRRNIFKSSSLAQNRDSYLNFCSKYYSGIKWRSDSALSCVDDPKKNTFTIKEEYFIENIWEHRDKDSIELYMSCYPYNMYEFFSTSDDQKRNMPMHLSYPRDIEVNLFLHYPKYKSLGFDLVKDSVVNDFVCFKRELNTIKSTNTLHIKYTYKSLKDHVTAKGSKQYFKDYDRISELCEYPIRWGIQQEVEGFAINYGMLIYAILLFAFFSYLFSKYYKLNCKVPKINSFWKVGINGWMVFVAIGLYLSPLVGIRALVEAEHFNQNLWDNCMIIYAGQEGIVIFTFLFEIFHNLLLVAFPIFLLILMHKKRSIFPKFYTFFRVYVVLGVILDIILMGQLQEIGFEEYKNLFSVTIGTAIWLPYIVMSTRVKATFVNQYEYKK